MIIKRGNNGKRAELNIYKYEIYLRNLPIWPLNLTLKKDLKTNNIEIGIYRKQIRNTRAIHKNTRYPYQQKLNTFAQDTMRPMEETMAILQFENDPKRINALEEMDIMKATTSDHRFNIVQNNKPVSQI